MATAIMSCVPSQTVHLHPGETACIKIPDYNRQIQPPPLSSGTYWQLRQEGMTHEEAAHEEDPPQKDFYIHCPELDADDLGVGEQQRSIVIHCTHKDGEAPDSVTNPSDKLICMADITALDSTQCVIYIDPQTRQNAQFGDADGDEMTGPTVAPPGTILVGMVAEYRQSNCFRLHANVQQIHLTPTSPPAPVDDPVTLVVEVWPRASDHPPRGQDHAELER